MLRNTLKEITEEIIGSEAKISSSGKKCRKCGSPYKLIPQVISIFGNEHDKSYQVPSCDCKRIEEERQVKKMEGQKIAAKIRELKDCGINLRFKGKTFSNFDRKKQPNTYDTCREYASSFGGNKKESLLLTGLVGTGKTHLAVAIADYIARLKHNIANKIIFTTVPDMVETVRQKMLQNITGYKEELFRCSLLILDDLGAESMTDWTKDVIHQIIDYRYREKLATVITTNLSLEAIRKTYGERLYSRIYEMCQGVELSGSDYRLGD
ncbi:ATP-binding protein [Actinomycetota bacterium]